MKVLFATTNPAKLKMYGKTLQEKGYEVVTLKDLNITTEVEETGTTPEENAIIKANAYYNISKLPTIAVDDALILENVEDHLQPGTNVRRINGKRLTDKEMITYYTDLVNKYGIDGKLNGYFLKGVAIKTEKGIKSIEVKSPRCFKNTSSKQINEGYPLASIQWVEELKKYKVELTAKEKEKIENKDNKKILDFIDTTILALN